MKTKPTTVQARDGSGTEVPADVIVCQECGAETFYVFLVGTHPHVQCASCDVTYCDGSCDT